MFYSQTFLARKGPLSTVWIAAHLQHRLKKSHYTSTDIPSTVEHIMDPGVPIALRMSSHLLLGVVRIYSKKVDYLFHDCNAVLTGLSKAFASTQLTLPEDARQAPVQSITLPDSFDLDAVNLDDELDQTGSEDTHMRSQEDITLTDRIPVSMDHYVAISFDEDIVMDSPRAEVLPDSGAIPMHEDAINVGFQDGGPSIQREIPTTPLTAGDHPLTAGDHPHNVQDPEATYDLGAGDNHSTTPQTTQPLSPEILRDANNDCNLKNPLVDPVSVDKDTRPIRDLEETMNEKDHIPDMNDEEMALPSQQVNSPRPPTPPQGDASGAQAGEGCSNPNFVLGPSPPNQQQQRRGRKRKHLFDESIVLTNRFMRGALNNPRDILRKRRDVTPSTLDVWKLTNTRRKEQLFCQPLLTGICNDLLDISKREYICSKLHLVISEEDHEDANIIRTPSPTNKIHEEPRPVTPVTSSALNMEIEGLRNVPTVPAHNMDLELNIGGDSGSPVGKDNDLTPVSPKILRSVPVSPETTNVPIGTMQTLDSPAAHGSVIETPRTNLDDNTFPNFDLSDAHQLIYSAATEDLSFLEVDNNSPASSQCTTGGGISMSVRTRAAAQYLKRQITPIMEDPSDDLSLNKILEGKTRRVSARMFFEVLVLKSHGLVEVQQENPYGDVTLKLTAAFKHQI